MIVFDVMNDANLDINYSSFILFEVKIVDSIKYIGITNRDGGRFGFTGK